jgi:hypothetical protein
MSWAHLRERGCRRVAEGRLSSNSVRWTPSPSVESDRDGLEAHRTTRGSASVSLVSRSVFIAVIALLCSAGTTFAAPPAPPGSVRSVDHPNDAGTAIDVIWSPSADEGLPAGANRPRVLAYRIERRDESSDEWKEVGEATAGVNSWTDTGCVSGKPYVHRVSAVAVNGEASTPVEGEAVRPVTQWLDRSRLGYGGILFCVCAAVVGYILAARRGVPMKLRPIAGLQAVDEAVGRATEMGKPCLFVPGVQDINEMMTVAGIVVLGRVARTAAEYDCELLVPTSRSLVMTACRETVQSACYAAGRPEAYREDDISYLADEQFAYVAGVTRTMIDRRPAACFYFGQFYAESLFLAESGNAIGALQIAGTAETTQLPFFVAACDYTLIGEEFFAASAYLSGEPDQLGAVKGQDVGKLIAAGLILYGVLLATGQQFASFGSFKPALEWFRAVILGAG